MIKPIEFIHPEDAAALRQLENIPGFPAIAKKVLELGYEKLKYGLNMASTIRLSPTQCRQSTRNTQMGAESTIQESDGKSPFRGFW